MDEANSIMVQAWCRSAHLVSQHVLVKHMLFKTSALVQVSGKSLQGPVPWAGAGSLGHALLEPTLIYVKRLLALTEAVQVKASSLPLCS